MGKVLVWMKNGLALVGVLALGFWLGAGRTVHAAIGPSGQGFQFQLTGLNQSNALLVYHPDNKTIYVYQGAMTGNAALQCTYMFQMDRPGEVIRRVPCAVQNLNP